MEILSAEHVPQGGGGQQPGRLTRILDVDHGVHGVEDLEVDDSINSLEGQSRFICSRELALYTYHGNAVLGEDLLGRDIKGDGPQVHGHDRVQAGDDEEQPGTNSSTLLDFPQPEYDGPLVLLNHLNTQEEVRLLPDTWRIN